MIFEKINLKKGKKKSKDEQLEWRLKNVNEWILSTISKISSKKKIRLYQKLNNEIYVQRREKKSSTNERLKKNKKKEINRKKFIQD